MTNREIKKEAWSKTRGFREKLLKIDGLNRLDASNIAYAVQEEVDKLETLDDCIALFKNADAIAKKIIDEEDL